MFFCQCRVSYCSFFCFVLVPRIRSDGRCTIARCPALRIHSSTSASGNVKWNQWKSSTTLSHSFPNSSSLKSSISATTIRTTTPSRRLSSFVVRNSSSATSGSERRTGPGPIVIIQRWTQSPKPSSSRKWIDPASSWDTRSTDSSANYTEISTHSKSS
jgi:hypothetical protein